MLFLYLGVDDLDRFPQLRLPGAHQRLRVARPLRARKACPHRHRGQELPAGSGEQRRRGPGVGDGLLRGLPHPEGKDARRSADPRDRRGAAARHRARRPPGAVQHGPPVQHRLRRSTAQAHARARTAVADWPRGRRDRRRTRAAAGRTRPRDGRDRRHRRPGDPHRSRDRPALRLIRYRRPAPRARGCRRKRRLRAGGRVPTDRVRPTPLRGRSRRQRDPTGSWSERPRGLVHEGLLRRAGDGRAALLPRQAEPAPART